MDAKTLRGIIEYKPDTGEFIWLVNRRSHAGKVAPGAAAGARDSTGRLRIMIDQRMYSAPRLAWLYMTGKFPKSQVDHIDGDPRNNKFSNLREATPQENAQNIKKPRSHSKSGLLGVISLPNGKYQAKIVVRGKPIWLGTFTDALDAHTAYLEAKRKLHSHGTL